MSNLQPNCCLKFDFQKVDQHTSQPSPAQPSPAQQSKAKQKAKQNKAKTSYTWDSIQIITFGQIYNILYLSYRYCYNNYTPNDIFRK